MVIQNNLLVQVAEQLLEQLFQELAAGERIEVRHRLAGNGNPMHQEFFAMTKEAARRIVQLDKSRDVYVGIAVRRGEDGTKTGITRLWALWADLDLTYGHTWESRIKQLIDLPCRPSMLVWSGGGWHPYWLLTKPAEGPEELERAELVMRRLAEGLDGDLVHDRSRIMRVPGSFNHKYAEPRPVRLEHCSPDLCYELGKLEDMAQRLPKKAKDDPGCGGKVRRDILSGPIGEGERNVALASVAGSLRDRGLDAETACVVLLEVNRLRCEPPLGEQEVSSIGRSVSKYPAGRPRYRKSSARRIYRKEGR